MSNSKKIAIKSNGKLWEEAKHMACYKGKLCKHSARKMQWATKYYKSKNGRYKGKKSKQNALDIWTKQKWRTSNRKKSSGKLRYLPDKAWKAMNTGEKRRTNRAKYVGYLKDKQYVLQPSDVARKTRKYRVDKPRACKRQKRTQKR